jgi:DNA-binding XRE family transcriptional regulator
MKFNRTKVQRKLVQFLTTGAAKKGITNEDIASRLGVSYWTIFSWRSGKRVPKLPVILSIEHQFKTKLL